MTHGNDLAVGERDASLAKLHRVGQHHDRCNGGDLVPFGLTMGDYEVLVRLSEAEDQRLRMCDLATALQLSPSGLTRRLDGLVKTGLVERIASPTDRRVMFAALTHRPVTPSWSRLRRTTSQVFATASSRGSPATRCERSATSSRSVRGNLTACPE